ncbi:hypothetical protein JQ636_07615 [Bradyrhizobium japonicum]|uniref:hypothetical protein n=1 Tax=Bradyrhizobium japonicum TaxID=375 RepID=UPI001BA468B4|nr:hypothetical protein [Bradyrhizobium japonicum]MBR0803405.1 hypothetical protein [Bradyrhizobium japonicum]
MIEVVSGNLYPQKREYFPDKVEDFSASACSVENAWFRTAGSATRVGTRLKLSL